MQLFGLKIVFIIESKNKGIMMKKAILFFSAIILMISSVQVIAQTSNAPQKKMWAKSVLGEKAPELEVEAWIQEPANLKGKYILVDIWATWCGPCRKGIPELNEWQKKFADQLVIIGISNEPKEKAEPFAKENIEYANGYDTQSRVKNALKVTGIPHVIIINPEGIVVWEGFPKLPGHELTTEVLKDLMK